MIKKIKWLLLMLAISGCSTFYTYNGKRYETLELMQAAVDDDVSSQLSSITPLPTPLSQKKLIFAIPSAVATTEQDTKIVVSINGKEPSRQEKEVRLNINRANFKTVKVYFDAIQKRNIYASTQFLEMDSTTGSLAPSQNTDTLFLVYTALNSTQFYYASQKQGKQIFAFDRSSPTGAGKVQAFVDAVQAMAIRD